MYFTFGTEVAKLGNQDLGHKNGVGFFGHFRPQPLS